MRQQPGRVDIQSPDLAAKNRRLLEKTFPGLLADGVLDADRLGELLGVDIAGRRDGPERYGLMWAGKGEAVRSLVALSRGALIPDPEASVDPDSSRDIFIEGDNLEVLKLMQKAYNDQVKLIYVDPPYNTGNDFVYTDDYRDTTAAYLRYSGQSNPDGTKVSAGVETAGRIHSHWLSMMFPRLALLRNLLTQDGLICVSIDDNELANLILVMDELFGRENFVTTFAWKKRGTGGQVAKNAIIEQVEYVVTYARNVEELSLSGLPNERAGKEKWRDFRKAGGQWQRRYRPNQFFPLWSDIEGRLSLDKRPDAFAIYPLDSNGEEGFWENGLETTAQRLADGELRGREIRGRWKVEQLEVAKGTVSAGSFVDIPSTRGTTRVKDLLGAPLFDNPKPTDLIEYLLHISNVTDGDLVLDPFAGSCTTGDAIIGWRESQEKNISYIMINLPEPVAPDSEAHARGFETISDIGVARLRAALQELPPQSRGLSAFQLTSTNFDCFEGDGQLDLRVNTLGEGEVAVESIVSECLLAEGVRLELQIAWYEHPDGSWASCDGVAVVPTRKLTRSLVEAVLLTDPSVVVFLEDAFAGLDALKSDTFFNCQQRDITMKTL